MPVLVKGDTIVMYTDGMTEATNTFDEEFGEERLGELLNKCGDLTAKNMVEKLVKDVLAFQTGRDQFDDMTLLVMKVTA